MMVLSPVVLFSTGNLVFTNSYQLYYPSGSFPMIYENSAMKYW